MNKLDSAPIRWIEVHIGLLSSKHQIESRVPSLVKELERRLEWLGNVKEGNSVAGFVTGLATRSRQVTSHDPQRLALVGGAGNDSKPESQRKPANLA